MTDRKALTREALAALITYNPDDGSFLWLRRADDGYVNRTWNKRFAGTAAFARLNAQGYRTGTILGQTFTAHRAAWLLTYGSLPAMIDHIDGDRANCRIVNLRDATRAENNRNVRRRADNASGTTGVHWHRASRKWRAHITVDGAYVHLGLFGDLDAAKAARAAAAALYGFSPRHGAAA